ncbi:MAG: hypothetical protein DI619_02120 [Francisella sp.]|nr:MAG: hypothetical protein DI619_02120 [Francisella sp.]
MRILITGASGQLGKTFLRILRQDSPSYCIFAFSHAQLDVTNQKKLEEKLSSILPDYFINLAAYTDITQAEIKKTMAWAINAIAPASIAKLCKRLNIRFIHLSSNYVFSGLGPAIYYYREQDQTSPLNYYGFSKQEGEKALLHHKEDALIIRTSSLYSPELLYPHFIHKILEQLKAGHTPCVFINTYTQLSDCVNLAIFIKRCLTDPPAVNIIHFSGLELTNYYTLAQQVAQYYAELEDIKVPYILKVDPIIPPLHPPLALLDNSLRCQLFPDLDNKQTPIQEIVRSYCAL